MPAIASVSAAQKRCSALNASFIHVGPKGEQSESSPATSCHIPRLAGGVKVMAGRTLSIPFWLLRNSTIFVAQKLGLKQSSLKTPKRD